MKYLVLGSSGLVGRYLTQYLRDLGHIVHEFDINLDCTQDLRIPDNDQLIDLVIRSDLIFFLAFDVGGYKYLIENQSTYRYINNNVKIMLHTFDIINQYKKPVIFTSTQMVDMPGSAYGALKRLGEFITESVNGMAVRLWNIYGKEYDLHKSHVITDLIIKGLKKGKIELISDGTEVRQFLHSSDCARCLAMLGSDYEQHKGVDIHITNGQWVRVIDIANIIGNILNVEVIPGKKHVVIPTIEPDVYIRNYWKPVVNLTDGIKSLIDYYSNIIDRYNLD